jgi:acetyl esterase
MPLHPFIAAELAAAAAGSATPYHELPIGQARLQMKRAYARQALVEPVEVCDIKVDGPAGALPVRLYRTAEDPGSLPLTVFFHGSGFCALDLDTHDEICRRLALGSGTLVASVDYRLAPECPFPAAPDDCLAATRALSEHAGQWGADAERLTLAGDSAGACLALVTALRLSQEAAAKPQALLLWYPVTDHPNSRWPSYQRYASGYGLTAAAMIWFWRHYLPDPVQADHPHASPLRADDLQALPPTWLMTAEYDVLHDEGQALAHRLHQASVPVELHCARGLNHGFLKHAARLPEAADAMHRACAWLRQHQTNTELPHRRRFAPIDRPAAFAQTGETR